MDSIDSGNPASGEDGAGRSRRRRMKTFRWYKMYFVLAAFDVLTVTFSLGLHHRLSSIYAAAVEDNQRWADRHELFEDLQFQIVSINAPGNDVFESRNVEREKARQQTMVDAFRQKISLAKKNLGEGLSESATEDILSGMETLERLTDEMIAESELLYQRFSEGDIPLAARHMANMDQTYARLIETVSIVERVSIGIHDTALAKQDKLATQTRSVEFVIAGLILLMVMGIVIYGYRLSRQMAQHEKERAEYLAALEVSEQRFRELTEGSIEGIAVHRDGRPLFLNRAWTEMHGVDYPQNLETMANLADFIAPEDRSAVWDIQYELQLGTEQPRRYECRGLRGDGSTFWMECLERVISWQDRPALQMTVIDITERKIAENDLRSAILQTDQATSARTRFFAAASHDLRQPLHAISLYLPLLEKQVKTKKGREMVAALENSADAMRALLNSILDISRLDAGVIKPDVVPVSLLEVFDQLGMEFTPQAKHRSLELRVQPADYWVMSDPALLERILRNLLSNAIGYTLSGKILMGARRAGKQLRIEIWDTGIGIPPESLTRVFEEFYQEDNPERDRSRGLGLGLAIIDKLAKLMDHRLGVRSWPGKGSVFSITLLRCDEPAHSVPARLREAAVDHVDLSGRIAVVIDDNIAVLDGSRAMLSEWGLEVIDAESIAQAVEKLESAECTPDVILADLRLRNNETGLQAVKEIRNVVAAPVPAIIITGDTDPGRIRQAADSDCTLMHKPVKPEKLRTAVSNAIRSFRSAPVKSKQLKRAAP